MPEEHAKEVRDLIVSFMKGFSKTLPHREKIDRYVDVLAKYEIDKLRDALEHVKGAAALPAPGKIKDAIAVAALRRLIEKRKAEREEIERRLADPVLRDEMRAQAAEAAGSLLGRDDVLDELVADVNDAGLVGEDRAAKLLFLALHTRHFDLPGRPVSCVVKGTSSGGKSFSVKTLKKFFAPGSVIEMTGMSPKWMAYAAEQGLDFSHCFLFVHEAAGIDEEVESMLRVLLSEGEILWRTVIDQQAHTLHVKGPTGLIETTTRLSLHWENETRLLSIPIDESTKQTERVLRQLGNGSSGAIDFERWHALDRWIGIGPRTAVIPFQQAIGELAKPVATRVRRDMTTLLELVRAHALLHESVRETNAEGQVIASLDDYTAVYDLTAPLFADAVELVVNPNVRNVVNAACEIISEKVDHDSSDGAIATSAEIARRLNKDRRSTNRWLEGAVEAEFLEAVMQRGQGVTNRVRPGTRPLPDEKASVFPTGEEISDHLQRMGVSECPPSHPSVQVDPGDGAETPHLGTWALGQRPGGGAR